MSVASPAQPMLPDEPRDPGALGSKSNATAAEGFPPFRALSLSSEWQPVYEWACRARVFHEWILLLETALLRELPYALGGILEELSSSVALEVLEHSAAASTAAQALLNLANAFLTTTDFPKNFRPTPRGLSAKALLSGPLRQLYFLALAVDLLPPASKQYSGWLDRLRIWFYIHAADQGQRGNVQDQHLRVVADRLRNASRHSEDWRTALYSLYTPATALDSLDRWIEFKCKKLTASLDSQDSSHQQAYRVFQRVAKGESLPEYLVPGGSSRLLSSTYPFEVPRIFESEFGHIDDSDAESGHVLHARRYADDDGDTDLAAVNVEDTPSYTHQRLKANGILLFNADDSAFLPWAWDTANPSETAQLSEWILVLLGSPPGADPFIGSLTWVASRTGRSLRRALDLPLTSHPVEDWAVDLRSRQLVRHPPRRAGSWSPKSDRELRWIPPSSPIISIPLPDAITLCLDCGTHDRPNATCLGDLWEAEWGRSPESWFKQHVPSRLSRLTPGMLAGILPQRLFAQSNHAVFARTVASHPKSGLPGACAYGNWSRAEVEAHLAPTRNDLRSFRPPPPPIGAGSRLDPIETLLIDAITVMADRVSALHTKRDMVAFHNAYTAYLCIQLWAATGARPVRDPFESPRHFDLEERFVFLDDKASGNLRQGRLVPLPADLARYVERVYPRHLRAIATALAPKIPHLARNISLMANREETGEMPYFFFLDVSTSTGWDSVSEASILRLGLLDCPLPFNLFRQRLPKQLHRLGCDAEIIDGLLGHAEAMLATYGDQSPRVWVDDMAVARPLLERAYANLHFTWIRGWHASAIKSCRVDTTSDGARQTILYGSEAREQKRRATLFAAIRDARLQIRRACGEREITDLSPDELDKLTSELLINANGLPRPTGYFRYQFLMRALERAWRKSGKRVRIKTRYVRLTESSPFSDHAPGALRTFGKLRELLRQTAVLSPASRMSLANCRPMAAIELAVGSRITFPQLLLDVMLGENFRIVQRKRQSYLEYGRTIKGGDPDAAATRYAISPYAAALLDRIAKGQKPGTGSNPEISSELHALATCLYSGGTPPTQVRLSALVKSLCNVVDQVNAITLPGLVGGFLSGRLRSYSLGWRDWISLETGQILHLDAAPIQDAEEDGVLLAGTGFQAPSGNADAMEAGKKAWQFFSDLRAALVPGKNGEKQNAPQLPTQDLPKSISKESRDTVSSNCKKILLTHRAHVSSAVHLLGQWAFSIIHRKVNSRNHVVLNTVQRYLSALSPAFQDVAASVDVFALDEEGITEFYRDILAFRAPERPGYVVGRLLDFHRWAKCQGLPDPDWDELPLVTDTDIVSPGILSEEDYQSALAMIEARPGCAPRQCRGMAMVLLLCYRFGLRPAEALGMTRDDWVDTDDGAFVLVRHHPFRKLKTPVQSRRQVPLVFQMTGRERKLIRHWLHEYVAMFGDDLRAPLFTLAGDRTILMSLRESSVIVRDTLKQVTGNPSIHLHHARHTALNRVACALLKVSAAPWKKLCKTDNPEWISQILLGTTPENTRRIGWALRRYAGHGATNTIFRSYLHLLGEWAGDLTADCRASGNYRQLKTVVNLDALPLIPKASMNLIKALPPITEKRPDSAQAIQVLRLLARGIDSKEAGDSVGVPISWVKYLVTAVQDVATYSKGRHPSADVEIQTRAFLARMRETAWSRLHKHCLEREEAADREAHPLKLPPDSMSALNLLCLLLGERRQLVMWTQEHLAFGKAAIDFLGIPQDHYICFHNVDCNETLVASARKIGFNPMSAKTSADAPPHQLDAIELGDGNFQRNRCALVFRENRIFAIRNSIEYALALMAYAARQC